MVGTFPCMWSKKALIALSIKGGSDINFESVIETIDIDEGEKEVSDVNMVSGGKCIKLGFQGMTTVTFEGYPVGIGTTQASDLGFSQQFNGGTWDITDPLSTSPTTSMDQFRVAIMWTNDTTATAVSATATDKVAYRWSAVDSYITSVKKAFTDGGLKFTVTMVCPPLNKSGTALITEESTNGTTAEELTALGAYV